MTDKQLLQWLAQEESSALGECHGKNLTRLAAAGLVRIGEPPLGRDRLHARVTVTEAGLRALRP